MSKAKRPAAPRVGRWKRLFEPVDISSLIFFRLAFGALLVWEVCRYFDHGWIREYYIDPKFHFTYYGFGWVHPWAGDGMYYHFIVLGVLAACILAGFFYRVAASLFFLGFTYVFLLDQTRYLNHFYLISLISFLLILVPANRAFSIDAWRKPELRSPSAPRWALWLLRTQFALVYIYGGIAKMNSDWLQGEPLRKWLASESDLPLIGRWFTEDWMVMLFAWGGLLFDLLAVPLLLWRKTRVLAFLAAIAFHVLNAQIFRIGIFPWFALAGTMLFFPPDWPRRLIARFKRKDEASRRALPSAGSPQWHYSKPVAIVLGCFLVLQLLMPLRHLLYPGNVSWTEEGHRFAWHMKLRTKRGTGRFFAYERDKGWEREINPREYLKREQVRSMWTHPDMVLQFSHFIAAELRREGWQNIDVQARVTASLNGRDPQYLIDPRANLAVQKRNLLHARWILPLTEPLPVGN